MFRVCVLVSVGHVACVLKFRSFVSHICLGFALYVCVHDDGGDDNDG